MVTQKELTVIRQCPSLNRIVYQRIADYVDNLIWEHCKSDELAIKYTDIKKMLNSTTISLTEDEIYNYLRVYSFNSEFECVFTTSCMIIALTIIF